MSQQRVVTLVCDQCGSEDMVETQRVTFMGRTVEAEVCDTCLAVVIKAFGAWAHTGRPVPTRSRLPSRVAWPDTDWEFTHHALMRMGERHLTPHDVLRTLERPDVTRPGRASDQEVRVRRRVKVVCVPDRRVILTVAHVDDDEGDMATVALAQ